MNNRNNALSDIHESFTRFSAITNGKLLSPFLCCISPLHAADENANWNWRVGAMARKLAPARAGWVAGCCARWSVLFSLILFEGFVLHGGAVWARSFNCHDRSLIMVLSCGLFWNFRVISVMRRAKCRMSAN